MIVGTADYLEVPAARQVAESSRIDRDNKRIGTSWSRTGTSSEGQDQTWKLEFDIRGRSWKVSRGASHSDAADLATVRRNVGRPEGK